MPESPVRVRFAPSPTGYLHVGGLRTALYNSLFAKKNGGTYLLRIEDTDQSRYVPGAIESLVRSLDRMGLNADEGVVLQNGEVAEVGERGPYQQSKRLALYKEQAEKLVASGHAYYCFCTPERLAQIREEQVYKKLAPKYDKHCLSLEKSEIGDWLTSGEPYVIRFNMSADQEVAFSDMVRGPVQFQSATFDDQILIKSDGFPTGVFAIVVDDIEMGITHVIKGEEWLPTTPKQVLMYTALGAEVPSFAHLPLLLNPDKSKLSKRQGDVAVEDYLKKGYLEEALLNFVALLGWNPGKGSTQEIFSLEELVEQFDFSHIHKGGAVFDHKKLDWMNSEYIKKLSIDELFQRMVDGEFFDRDFIKSAPESMQTEAYLRKVLVVEQERLATLGDFGKENPFLFVDELHYDAELLVWKENSKEATVAELERAIVVLQAASETLWEDRNALQGYLLEAAGEKRGDFLWPLRVALTGAQRSPSPADVSWVLGEELAIQRLRKAIMLLS